MKSHEENLKIYIENGGDVKIANRYRLASIQNRAKISYLVSQQSTQGDLKMVVENVVKNAIERPLINLEALQPSKPKFLGFINQYPTDLHGVYKECYNAWLDVCRLKLQLNEIAPLDQNDAYELQEKIISAIRSIDRLKKILDYWIEHKRILPTESKRDFSKMSALELDQERRNLASLISRRKQTIQKKENELPERTSLYYRKKESSLQQKKEQLQELILDFNKIIELLKTMN